jgi:hypothetical protein
LALLALACSSADVVASGDVVEPESVIAYPAVNQVVPHGSVTVVGTTSDDVAVGAVEVALRDRDTLLWWHPETATWGEGQEWIAEAVLDNSTTTSSGWALTLDQLQAGGRYRVVVRSIDEAGNRETNKPAQVFTMAP